MTIYLDIGDASNIMVVVRKTFNKTTPFKELPILAGEPTGKCKNYCNNEPRCKAALVVWYSDPLPGYQHTCKLLDQTHKSDDELFYAYYVYYIYKVAECDPIPISK